MADRDKICPVCGFHNRSTRTICELCQSPFAGHEPPRRNLTGDPAGRAAAKSLPAPVYGRRDFAAEVAANRRRSLLLMAAFLVLTGLLGFAAGYGTTLDPVGGIIGVAAAALATLVYLLIAYYAGGRMTLAFSGAKEIGPDHPDFRQLVNVVEEMRIASGLPMPKIYVIEDTAPNAFATGRDPEHAVVAVTRGLLQKLNREELQGVVAHEMAHIHSLDIRYMMLVAVLVGVVALISDFFLRSLRYGRGGRGGKKMDGRAAVLLLALVIVFAILAPIASRLLQMAISRKRELLADARAVEFTRNPTGLADALLKISQDTEPLEVANRATQHLYIVNPLKRFGLAAGALFSTHPPIETRVNLLRQMGSGVQTANPG